MKPDEILDAMEHIDAELIEVANKVPKRNSLTAMIAALAAMLVLLIGISIVLWPNTPVQMGSYPTASTAHVHVSGNCPCGWSPFPTSGTQTTAPTQPDTFTVPLVDQLREPQKLTGMQQFGAEVYPDVQEIAPYMEFWVDMVVEARVIKILPDVYKDPFYGYSYYVLVMETLEAFNVENMPKLFYYRLPYPMSPDFGSI